MIPFPKTPAGRAGAALGFLAMAALGWKVADLPQAPSAVKEAPAADLAKPAKRPDRVARRGGAPEAVRQQVAGLRAISSSGDRMRATIELATTLPTSEIAAWLDGRWFDTGRGFDVTLFNKILKERWEKEDPEGLVLWGLKNNPSQASNTLAKWAETDPQRTLAFFKEHPNRDLEMQTLALVAKKNPAVALQALLDMPPGGASRNGMSGYYTGQLLQQLAEKAPDALERALESLPVSLQTTAEAALIGRKLKTSFTTEIEKLWARPDGWKIFETALRNASDGMGDQILARLADMPAAWRASIASDAYSMIGESDPEKWCKLDLEGMGFTAEQAGQIHSMALTKFGYKNPEAALKLMAGMELSDGSRQNMIGNVFRNFRGGAEKAEALLALLGSEEDKKTATDAMARNSSVAVKVETPDDWIEKVSATDPNSGGFYQDLLVLRRWDQQKINDLRSRFQSMPDERKQNIAMILVRNNGYADNIQPLQADALRYLIANPVEQEDGRQRPMRINEAASEFAVKWLQSDPTAAGDWVRSLPAGEARQWAQKNLAANLAQYDPEATEQWINSLPPDDRAPVRDFIESGNNQR